MHAKRHAVVATTDKDGAATVYTGGPVNGRLISIRYVKTDFEDGVIFVVTGEETGLALWSQAAVNDSVTVCPRQPTCDSAGAASLYAANGEPVEDYMILADERVKIVVSSGGNIKTGMFHITMG